MYYLPLLLCSLLPSQDNIVITMEEFVEVCISLNYSESFNVCGANKVILNFKADFACDIDKSNETVIKPYEYIFIFPVHS